MTLRPDDIRLDDKVVVVTGAAAGIGRATALAAARFGADLAICDRNAEGLATAAKEIEASGRRVVTGELDVRHGDAVAQHLDEVRDTFGRVDVLVNNAGGTFNSLFLDTNAKGQQALVDENFTSVTHFIRGCVPLMTDGGSIVNITSVEAHRAAPGYAVYAAMKAAVENLTRTLALELAERLIRVNAVAVDAIPTEGDAGLAAESGQGELYWTPLDIEGHPDDVAAAILWLASPMSRFVTGSTVHVGGGTDAARGWKQRPDGTWRP